MKEQTHEQHPIVAIAGDRVTTTSLSVAACFDKQHKDVLKAIKGLDVPEEFGRRNFAPTNYLDSQGRKQEMYEITRDGFAVLVMGFTGPKAMRFKLAYIDAFNRMEETLRRRQADALIAETKRGALEYFRKGAALTALLQRRDSLEKVEQFYWFRVHGQLAHYEAAHVCNISMPEADVIARSLRDIGLALPVLQGQVRKAEISRFFSAAVGGFLPEEVRGVLADLRKEVAHA
jgi:Rha family phage regulatory protein